MVRDIDSLLNSFASIDVSGISYSEDEVDVEAVKFYLSRFQLCDSDGCGKATLAYMDMMQKDMSLNTSTRLAILYKYEQQRRK